MIKNKRGTETWQIIALILTVIIIVLVIYGIFTGKLAPLFKKVRNMIYSVLSLVGYDYSTPLPPVKTAVILGKDRNVTFHEGDGTNFDCETKIDNGKYKVQYDTSKKDYALWEWLNNGEWKNIDEQILSDDLISTLEIYKTLINAKNQLSMDYNGKKCYLSLDSDWGIKTKMKKDSNGFLECLDSGTWNYAMYLDNGMVISTYHSEADAWEVLDKNSVKDYDEISNSFLNINPKNVLLTKMNAANSKRTWFGGVLAKISILDYKFILSIILDAKDGSKVSYGIDDENNLYYKNNALVSDFKWYDFDDSTKKMLPQYLDLDSLKDMKQIKQELVETCENW